MGPNLKEVDQRVIQTRFQSDFASNPSSFFCGTNGFEFIFTCTKYVEDEPKMKCPECSGKIYYDPKFCEYVCEACGLVVATNRKLLYIKTIVRGKYDLGFMRHF